MKPHAIYPDGTVTYYPTFHDLRSQAATQLTMEYVVSYHNPGSSANLEQGSFVGTVHFQYGELAAFACLEQSNDRAKEKVQHKMRMFAEREFQQYNLVSKNSEQV